MFDGNKVTTYNVISFINFDYSGNLDHRRSICDYIFTFCMAIYLRKYVYRLLQLFLLSK